MQTTPFHYDEVRVEKSIVQSGQPNASLVIQGNSAYKHISAYAFLVTKEDGTPFTGSVEVGLTTSDGHTILPSQPYHMVRPSFMEKHHDRVIKIKPQKGFGRDFRFRFDFSGNTEKLNVYAIAYFDRN